MIALNLKSLRFFGVEFNNASPANTIASSNNSYDEIINEDKLIILGSQILFQWEQNKEKMEHDYSIAGWALGVMPAVQDDVVDCMTGVHCDAIERVVTKIHEPPCPNKSKEIEGKIIGDILHMFWLDFKVFQHKTRTFVK